MGMEKVTKRTGLPDGTSSDSQNGAVERGYSLRSSNERIVQSSRGRNVSSFANDSLSRVTQLCVFAMSDCLLCFVLRYFYLSKHSQGQVSPHSITEQLTNKINVSRLLFPTEAARRSHSYRKHHRHAPLLANECHPDFAGPLQAWTRDQNYHNDLPP
jgi:hypothetical protein